MTERVLVLGSTGMLGHKLCEILAQRFDTAAASRVENPSAPVRGVRRHHSVDVLDATALEHVVSIERPDVVLNAVGLVKQRDDVSDAIAAIQLNSLLPHRLAYLCRVVDATLIHFSTDCVFSGDKGSYTEDDRPDPIDLYGRSKLLGEVDDPALTIRTSIIGPELGRRQGLVEWFLGERGGQVFGYRRAIFSGLTTLSLAELVGDLIDRKVPVRGVWHVSSRPISKYELLTKLNDAFDARVTIVPDERVVCDRSLLSDRFWHRVQLSPPDWDTMIMRMREDMRTYEHDVA